MEISLTSGLRSPAKRPKISPILPSPQYHLELVRNGETLTYQIFLDNRDEYLEFLKKQGKTEEVLGNIEINVNCGGGVWLNLLHRLQNQNLISGGNDTNTMFTAQATSADLTFTGSAKVVERITGACFNSVYGWRYQYSIAWR